MHGVLMRRSSEQAERSRPAAGTRLFSTTLRAAPLHPAAILAAPPFAATFSAATFLAAAFTAVALVAASLLLTLPASARPMPRGDDPAQETKPPRTIHVKAQSRPGGPIEEFEMEVLEVPVDPPVVAARRADLDEDDLVLGVVADGQALAFPIRYLAMFEVVNSRLGKLPMAPTW